MNYRPLLFLAPSGSGFDWGQLLGGGSQLGAGQPRQRRPLLPPGGLPGTGRAASLRTPASALWETSVYPVPSNLNEEGLFSPIGATL